MEKQNGLDPVEQLIQYFGALRHFLMINNRTTDLKPGDVGVLMCLMHHTNEENPELKPSQISALMQLQQPTITPALRRLGEKGYINRRRCELDRRMVYISLTEKARETLRVHRTKTYEMLQDLLDHMSPEDGAMLVKLMGQVTDYVAEQKTHDTAEQK